MHLIALLLILFSAKPVDLNLSALDGEKVHLRDYRGKVVVLNFWATWCGPCKEEMPMLVEAEKAWADKGVVFLAASLDDKNSQSKIPEFVKKYSIAFPVWVGARDSELSKLGMGEAVPATAFVDRDGVIFSRVQGEMRKAELEERLAWITGDKTGQAPAALVRHL
jgi:cytochrome c biogenesis protein CcmG, thiol:disulfide interchange protein DsbE